MSANAGQSPGFGEPGAWSDQTFHDGADNIRSLIAALKSDPNLSGRIEWSRVGLVGHALGGYTVLGLAGAWPSWKLPYVKAVPALSPYCSPFTANNTIGGIGAPVMYKGGTRDIGITPLVARNGRAYDRTPPPANFIDFAAPGHFAWTDLNPKYQASTVSYSVAFLDEYLKGERGPDLSMRRDDIADLRSM